MPLGTYIYIQEKKSFHFFTWKRDKRTVKNIQCTMYCTMYIAHISTIYLYIWVQTACYFVKSTREHRTMQFSNFKKHFCHNISPLIFRNTIFFFRHKTFLIYHEKGNQQKIWYEGCVPGRTRTDISTR